VEVDEAVLLNCFANSTHSKSANCTAVLIGRNYVSCPPVCPSVRPSSLEIGRAPNSKTERSRKTKISGTFSGQE